MARHFSDLSPAYRQRIISGLFRGLTPSQAAGKPRKGEPAASRVSEAAREDSLRQLERQFQEARREPAPAPEFERYDEDDFFFEDLEHESP